MNRLHEGQRARTARYVAEAMGEVLGLMPGRGVYRPDRVAVAAHFLMQAARAMAMPHVAGPTRTAAALRRLADLVENGEAERVADALDGEVAS